MAHQGFKGMSGCVGVGVGVGVGLGDDDDHPDSASISCASSGSASDLSDDAGYPPPGHSSEPSPASLNTLQLNGEGPLYKLSSLLAQLPVRRGLSKYYQGKSQSFTSIADATCLQDLAKKMTYSQRMKTCKSYTAGLDKNQRSIHLPMPPNKMIVKRTSKGSFPCLLSGASTTNLLYNSAKLHADQTKNDVQTHMNILNSVKR